MSKIKVKVENGECGTGKRKTKYTEVISISENRMLWAMIYANKTHREMKTAAELQAYVQWRKAQMDFVFDFSQNILGVNREARTLEKSYKTTIGFDLGMVMANLVCNSLLKVKHLYHLNAGKYAHNVGAHVDYLAQNKNGYYAIEAKGTLGEQWQGKAQALEQLSNVSRVNGETPHKYAVLTRCKNGEIESRLIDPIDENDKNVEIPEEFWNYQNELYEMLERQTEILYGVQMKYVQVEGAFFGLLSPCDRWGLSNMANEKITETVLQERRYKVEIFEDGTVIGIEKNRREK